MSKLNLLEEEQLAIEVQKYPALYDKSRKEYKDKNVKANAWLAVSMYYYY